MEKINKFSPEVIEQLKYYVYRLIDPRTGQTFYVGKGKGNRVFAHVYDALKDYDGEKYSNKQEDDEKTKIRQIRDIRNAGLEVIHVIQRWGMSSETAFEVEAALIDCFAGLSNIQPGHDADHGVTNASELQRRLSLGVYTEPDFKYIIIKTTDEHRNDELNQGDLYSVTRSAWKINPDRAKEYKYVFAVVQGIVREVYEVDCWKRVEQRGRYEFEGKVAPDEIRKQVVGLRIPEYYSRKGMASPFLYSKEQ